MERWQSNIDAARTRMASSREVLSGIQSIAADLLSGLNALNGINPGGIDAQSARARSGLQRVAELLNTQADGVYVFAGQDTANPPVPNADGILSSGYYAAIAAAVGGLATAGASATAAATLAAAAPDAPGATPFSDYLSGAPARPAASVGPGQTAPIGMLANANAAAVSGGASTTGSHMRDLMRALATVGSLSPAQADDPGFAALVQDARASLTGAIAAMAATATALRTRLSGAEDADMAATLSDLSSAQTQLQASYRLIAGANDLSLVKFLV